ncbi:prolyl oligopeptidase family serine peptidase [Brevibacterium jeotgali]|uniref:Prolyl oligopeptidase n=1 Tax=Brevibacterium jeotgali TaxID=1262550 RepID=A0A2H1L2U2_9MICO|nr:prolyl oligopeptidase family serine peptidase [Brevibacterium jeotgali]TWC02432.1 prolyl oligopeptidase [Brevibacterium jeotgali]SMY11224.1 prolyl oligopeptidase [Brevibacterium jeotgali]
MVETSAQSGASPMPHDDFLWLEEIEGADALTWVDEQNRATLAEFFDDDAKATSEAIRAALDSEDRIPGVSKLGDFYFNFWRDRDHPKGLWRRTTWESYVTDDPEWELLLDVDALAAADGTEWVFHGARVRRTDRRRALVSLSPDGGDAHTVREFDLETKEFVDPADGFVLPTAKAQASWIDDDTLLIATDFGPGSLTDSTYPRSARLLRRGEALEDAREIMSVPVELLSIFTGVDLTPGFERAVIVEAIDFFNSRTWIRDLPVTAHGIAAADALIAGWTLIDVPTDVSVDVDRDLVLFRPRTDWEGAGPDGSSFSVPAGALAVARYDDVVHGGGAASVVPTVVFAPEAGPQPRTSLQGWSLTRDHLVLSFLTDVRSELRVVDRRLLVGGAGPAESQAAGGVPAGTPGVLPGRAVPGVDPLLSVGMGAVDPDDDATANDVWMTVSGYLTPTTLLRGSLGAAGAEGAPGEQDVAPGLVKQAPELFDANGLSVTQHFTRSADGTRVPYFQVGPAAGGADGAPVPVMLDGYGGFELSRLPGYAPTIGLGWLEKGGTYVVANIRGGGEYGPGWHTAALRENRQRAYEDFVAVARDLVARGVTVPQQLACSGGSNGGLLVGNMLTQFPDDFGAVSCGVPLLDMRRYTKLSAGASWAAEYGDPDDPADWEFIRTFSPYHLIDVDGGTTYPPVLFWTATSDDRVGPVQARKMAARMQRAGAERVWFFEDREGGHSAASDNEQAARTRALSYAFLMRQLNG